MSTSSVPSPSTAGSAQPVPDDPVGHVTTAIDAPLRAAPPPRPWPGTGRWPLLAAGALVAVYVLIFARGLGWQWRGIFTSTSATVPVIANAPRGASAAPPAQAAAPSVAQPTLKKPLPPTDEAPPRNATDKYGVSYDQNGVAVIGIDADPSGVYNVPPGRQLRIGGPQGTLFDVQPDGKLKPATAVREQPK